MAIFYSASNNGFFPDFMRDEYLQAGNWPDDLKEISDHWFSYLLGKQAEGKIIAPNEYGLPVLINHVVDPVAVAEETKRQLLSEAAERIAILQDAVDLSLATDDEKHQLIEWKKMRVLLMRINPEDGSNIEWPPKPE